MSRLPTSFYIFCFTSPFVRFSLSVLSIKKKILLLFQFPFLHFISFFDRLKFLNYALRHQLRCRLCCFIAPPKNNKKKKNKKKKNKKKTQKRKKNKTKIHIHTSPLFFSFFFSFYVSVSVYLSVSSSLGSLCLFIAL